MIYTKEVTFLEKEKFSILDKTHGKKLNFYIVGFVDGIIFDAHFKYTKKIKCKKFTLESIIINKKEIKGDKFFKLKEKLENNLLEFKLTKNFICLENRNKLYEIIELYF